MSTTRVFVAIRTWVLIATIMTVVGCRRELGSTAHSTRNPTVRDRAASGVSRETIGEWETVIDYGPWLGSRETERFLWGAPDPDTVPDRDQAGPERVIRNVRVSYKGQRVWIAPSAFLDLSEFNRVVVDEIPGGIRINIEGGDASTSYEASLIVDPSGLDKRTVEWSAFPKSHRETTHYTTRPAGD